MEKADLIYLSNSVGSLFDLPVRLYRKNQLITFYRAALSEYDPLLLCLHEVSSISDHVGYYITQNQLCYGIVNASPYKLIIGPTSQIFPGNQALKTLAFELNVPKEEVAPFVRSMNELAKMSLERLLSLLCALNSILNKERLQISDIAIVEPMQKKMKQEIEKNRTDQLFDEASLQSPHNTLQLEDYLMSIVSSGDPDSLKEWLEQAPAVRGGILAGDQLRQLRNIFIVTATLTSRAAIRGGMDSETAFSLSDAYIQEAESLSTQSGILNLQYNMLSEFTEQVHQIRQSQYPSKMVLDVANYIHHHLSETIRTDQIAKEFYMSRTYFAAKFKKESGMTLTMFIHQKKIEESKRLLRFSDKSITAIGTYLGFSSHAHFSRVFKNVAGITPNEFRKNQVLKPL